MITKSLTRSIAIDAPARDVWGVLAAVAAYHRWNPFIVFGRVMFRQQLESGRLLEAHLSYNQGKTNHKVTARIVMADTLSELRWVVETKAPFLWRFEHAFFINPKSDTQVEFVHRRRSWGLAAPFIRLFTDKRSGRAMDAMNQALKKAAEAREGLGERG